MTADDLSRLLARANHIFIPSTKASRDRARSLAVVRLTRPLWWIYTALSDTGRNLAVLSLLLGALVLDLETTQGYWLWSAVTATLLGGLLLRPRYRLEQVRFEVSAPRQVTVGEVLNFELSLHNESARDIGAINIDRPLLPWDGSWQEPPLALAELPAGACGRVSTSARFLERGHHHLDAFWAAALVPGGLVQGARLGSGGVHFLAVPALANVLRLDLREGSRYQQGGVALASVTGESMELMGVRPYRAGDAVRDLHARSWARRGEPVVREYHQEYFSRVGVVLDTDIARSDARCFEAAISLAAGVIARLGQGESLIDVLVTGDRLHALTVGRSLGTLDQALDHLACVRPGPPLDPRHTTRLLGPYLERLSCVVVIHLSWDGERAQLSHSIESRGCAVRNLQVAESAAAPDARLVTPAAIESGAALVL